MMKVDSSQNVERFEYSSILLITKDETIESDGWGGQNGGSLYITLILDKSQETGEAGQIQIMKDV